MLKMKHLDGALRQEQMQDRVAARLEPQPARTVADIPDAELLGRVVSHVAKTRPRRQEFAWAAVSGAFGLGSTFSAQLLRRFGLDPDTGADLATPSATQPTHPAPPLGDTQTDFQKACL